ncbi:MAG: family 10 glycosylhydrolase [Candidatus Eisenbacteria bacterium]|nr:family 10 glycosylhydrolase [Candidatus Eisenbacteria bacterium]
MSKSRIDDVLRLARVNGFNALLVQVRGRGDALYDSRVAPRSELLEDPGFDPLAYVVDRAHSAGLEVHAWVNAFLVWSAPQPPRSPDHIVLAHRDWVHVLSDGRSLLELSRAEIEGMGAEGVFVSPGNPEVREHLRAVVRELVEGYDLDGVHLDYIRLPGMDVGYDVASRTEFMRRYGVDPLEMEVEGRAVERLYGDDGLRNLKSCWAEWRSSSVTQSVASVSSDVKEIRPSVKLSAAVVADVIAATSRYGQDWPAWLEGGLLDFAVPMCYSTSTGFVRRQVDTIKDVAGDKTIYPGLAIYNQSPSRVVEKVRTLRTLGVRGFAFFCHDPEQPRNYTLRALGQSVFSVRDSEATGGLDSVREWTE